MNRQGVGLIEVIVGMLVMTVGVLALAGSTSFVAVQIQAADMRTERSVARQQVLEELRAQPHDDVLNSSLSEANAVTRGAYSVWWTASEVSWSLMELEMYTRGPSPRGPDRRNIVVDTVTYRLARPIE